jgi:hypothetical protein
VAILTQRHDSPSLLNALDGELIVIENALQKAGSADKVKSLILKCIEEVSGEETAAALKNQGLEVMHELMTIPEIVLANHKTNILLQKDSLRLAMQVVQCGLGYKAPVYIQRFAIARFFPPFALVTKHESEELHIRNPKACCDVIQSGKIRPHSPHRDRWYGIPENTMNLWIALSEVIHGNGIVIFPQVFKKEVKHSGVVVDDAQNFGEGVNFQLQPGDLLLFNGDHLHQSEINLTQQTRVVISFRFYFHRPLFQEPLNFQHRYYNSRYIGTPLGKIFSVPTYFSSSFLHHFTGTVSALF